MKILGIETSFDETAVAIVENGTTVLRAVLATSSSVQRKYGGTVPEIAARKQAEFMIPVLDEAMQGFTKDDIDAIAVTVGPGLIGSLLVGVETAKTLAFVWDKPIIPVNHVLAHMYANFLTHILTKENSSRAQSRETIVFPAISLVVSGGHTELYLMRNEKDLQWIGGTLDDAAGEAFDKTARLLGFENRGGVAIQEAAEKYDDTKLEKNVILGSKATPESDIFLSDSGQARMTKKAYEIRLPRPMLHDDTLNFSFSGLKTAVMREWKKYSSLQATSYQLQAVFAFEIQEAITDVLVKKTLKAAEKYQAKSILISGGVAANQRLREKLMVHGSSFIVKAPPIELCTDNAVTIASYAYFRGEKTEWKKVVAEPNLSVEV